MQIHKLLVNQLTEVGCEPGLDLVGFSDALVRIMRVYVQ